MMKATAGVLQVPTSPPTSGAGNSAYAVERAGSKRTPGETERDRDTQNFELAVKHGVLSSETDVLSGETLFLRIGAVIDWCACPVKQFLKKRPLPLMRFSFQNRERVGVSVHQDCGSHMIIPFLDCDTAGSE